MRESHRWICNSWERGTESEANAPEDGRILNRVYENKYFGFSIRLPAGWICYRLRPALFSFPNVVVGHLVLFWARLSFTLAIAIFSLVFIAKRLDDQLAWWGYALTLCCLFPLLCYMQEVRRLREAFF